MDGGLRTVNRTRGTTERAQGREALLAAVDAVPGDDLVSTLGDVARGLIIPANIELVAIRLRDDDADQLFHLVAIDGASPRERRLRALHPLSIGVVKTLAALGTQHTLARALGLRWQDVVVLHVDSHPVGVIVTGSRTDRRPNERERRLIKDICARIAQKLRSIDRASATLVQAAHRIAREAAVVPEPSNGELDVLRPRERTIVALYAEGLPVDDIARLLVISPHTVRTHVKNAFRRLGVHSRDEAAQLLFADELRQLV